MKNDALYPSFVCFDKKYYVAIQNDTEIPLYLSKTNGWVLNRLDADKFSTWMEAIELFTCFCRDV